MKENLMTKLFTILALATAFTSPAIGEVVSSKQPGKAHCALNKPDEAYSSGVNSDQDVSPAKKGGSGQSAK
jgi:hypothetical protein